MRSKIKLLVVERSGHNGAAALRTERERLNKAFPGALSFLLGLRRKDRDLADIAAGAFNIEPQLYDAVLEIGIDDADASDSVEVSLGCLASRLGEAIDPELSTTLLGTEHLILPGDGALYVQIANRRLPHLSHQQFLQTWLNYHAPFATRNVPPELGMGYRQFHNDIEASSRLARAAGVGVREFDGAADCTYRDSEVLRDLMGRSDVVERATEDEKGFVDHRRCVTGLFDIARD
jgi:hypothetical protein